MAAYTIYLLDPSGRVRLGANGEHADDAAAIVYFRAFERHGEAAELWQSGRLLARFDADGVFFLGTSS